ncbi:MAG: AMP-binding protein [Hyphomicrobium sp.]|nr:AMP-binding protein [Hyphomicrobium sp.]
MSETGISNTGRAFNMAQYCIARSAAVTPSKIALQVFNTPDALHPVEEWTFKDIEGAVLQLAHALGAMGLNRGDRVAIRLGNSSRSALLFFACIAGGFIALPLSDQLTDGELRTLLDDSGASLIATSVALSDAAVPPGVRVLSADGVERMFCETNGTGSSAPAAYAGTCAEDPAYLIYTSGTTARPKGVLHAHRVAEGRAPTYQGWYGIRHDDRVLHAGAFNWTYTLGTGLIDPWANGATSLIYTGTKTPDVWPQLISKTGATLFAAVPSLFRQILKYAPPGPLDLGTLRHGLIAGERPPEDLFDAWQQRTGTPLFEALGMSEISTYVSTSPATPRKPGTTGKPQPGRRVAILPIEDGTEPMPPGTEGVIAVHRSDPGLMLRYWNRPDEDREVTRGEWFIGGDIGIIDEDGYLTHIGRANDVMNAFGYRVAPQEVEAVLALYPGVAEVACTEIPAGNDISIIAGFIVAAPGAALDAGAVKTFAASQLAAYKVPREIYFVDHLPRTANGKVKRSALRPQAAG